MCHDSSKYFFCDVFNNAIISPEYTVLNEMWVVRNEFGEGV